MNVRPSLRRIASVAAVATLAFCAAAPAAAGTTGRLAGRVVDAKKQPLAGANVILIGVPLGAATDADGRYAIQNVPAGTYSVKVSLIGYHTITVTQQSISADRTATLDMTLQEEAVQLKEVVVTARRRVVELGLTSNIATITRAEIAKLPVNDLQQIVDLQAGVVDGHFRGGRKGEVQFQIDGVTVNNPFNNESSVKLDRSVLEEVQVISGTFDAEYGNAMSGVVNAVLKRGTEKFEWTAEAFAGDYAFRGEDAISAIGATPRPPADARPVSYEFKPGRIHNYQLTVSGPTGLPKTLFLLSGRRGVKDGHFEGIKSLLQWDRSNPDTPVVRLGNQTRIPIGYTHEWLGVGKLTTRSIPGVELGYEAILNGIQTRDDNWTFRLNTDGLSKKRTFAAVHGFEMTHTLNANTFYRLGVRQNYFDYSDMVFEDFWDPRYDQAGPLIHEPDFELNDPLIGVSDTRFIQETSALVFSGTVSRQFSQDHQVKAGIEWQPTRVTFGHPGYLVANGETWVRRWNDPDNAYPDPLTFRPVIGSAYAQDNIEWNDLKFRAGLRFEYFNPKSLVPGDPQNPAGTIQGALFVPQREATRKLTFSPRLGVSYPVTGKSSLFFAYGHSYQMPQLGQIFDNANYSVLRNLQATDDKDWGVFGNPDVKPEHTVQYQFGYKQELRDWLGLDVTLFYKDIRDLLGSEVVITYNDADYKRLSNSDFGNVIGATIALDQREQGIVSSSLDYTWQVARGNSSDPLETAQRVDAHEDPRPRQAPLNWDQRHTLNLTVTLSRPQAYNVSAIFKAASGQPYTPESVESGFGSGLEKNSGRKPLSTLLDLRGERSLDRFAHGLTVFGTVYNVFDTRFFNGDVFANTGSPFYARDQRSPGTIETLSNPAHYYAPRRFEIGLRWERAGS